MDYRDAYREPGDTDEWPIWIVRAVVWSYVLGVVLLVACVVAVVASGILRIG